LPLCPFLSLSSAVLSRFGGVGGGLVGLSETTHKAEAKAHTVQGAGAALQAVVGGGLVGSFPLLLLVLGSRVRLARTQTKEIKKRKSTPKRSEKNPRKHTHTSAARGSTHEHLKKGRGGNPSQHSS
jgi:hypothetical protein